MYQKLYSIMKHGSSAISWNKMSKRLQKLVTGFLEFRVFPRIGYLNLHYFA